MMHGRKNIKLHSGYQCFKLMCFIQLWKKAAAHYTETFVTTCQATQYQNPEHQTTSYL